MKNWKTLLLGIAMIANTSFAAPQVVDKVAAVVNNGVVLESDVDGLMQSVKLNAGQAGQQLPDDATLRHQILERLIMDQIVLQMGQKMGVKVSDDQLDQAIANIAKQNNMTMDQMRSRLAYDGLNYNTYRNQIRKEMIISEVRNNEVRRRITILPQEVESLAQQVGNQNDASTELNLSHILIPLPENPTSDQVNEAESQARAIQKECFAGWEALSPMEARERLEKGFGEVDRLLNAAYKETMKNCRAKAPALEKLLRQDQRAWLKFVSEYVQEAALGFGEGGTVYLNMASSLRLSLWTERIAYLRIVNRGLAEETVQ